MQMLDGSCAWEAGGMEEDGCCCCCRCCGAEAGEHRTHSPVQCRRQTRRHRVARVLAVVLLGLFAIALVLSITVSHGGRGHRSPERQVMTQPVNCSSGSSVQRQEQEAYKSPRAMLTAPTDRSNAGEYLKWESKMGRAFCRGGFNYSNGNLVVPRAGIYRVFLQITYEYNGEHECISNELILSNKVLVFSDNYPKDVSLLLSADTVNCSLKHWKKTLYTAGLFSLEANSKLRVTSAHPKLIVNSESQMFFGAELLPN